MVVIPGRLFVFIIGYDHWFGSFDWLETFSIEHITFFYVFCLGGSFLA